MNKYNFNIIEKRWINYWKKFKIFKNNNLSNKSKLYILDMFPYPSGAGLHVGHPIGYIASDIYARYKRLEGFNILHPIGFDSFGLPTEQYAIQTGQHPYITTYINIKRYKYQMEKIGLSFDWTREINTSDPYYYKWTQWIFIQLFNSWYDFNLNKTRTIDDLKQIFKTEGNLIIKSINNNIKKFTYKEWNSYDIEKKELILQKYRLAFRKLTKVNWCPELGTVLSNNEIKDGKSERGGFKVYIKKMIQWSIRITTYAERLINGLKKTNWSNYLKEIQKNWIGKSNGVLIYFPVINNKKKYFIKIFTNEPYNIYDVNFIILSPENPIIDQITNINNMNKVKKYLKEYNKNNQYFENITGIFIGTYTLHPLIKNKKLPIYISNYITFDSITGAMLGVPDNNKWDYLFIKQTINKKENKKYVKKNKKILYYLRLKKIVYNTLNYQLRDAIFSRQRYWGEPIPIYYSKNIAYSIKEIPLLLPVLKKYCPSKKGKTPLSRSNYWAWDKQHNRIVSNKLVNNQDIFNIEKNTMPGWAGSSWYYLRYMSPKNNLFFLDNKSESYWKNVDIYIGGAEHATGHLIYSRLFHKFFKDRGWLTTDEPFNKIINQGMILGKSSLIARIKETNCLISAGLLKKTKYLVQNIYIDIKLTNIHNEVNINKLKKWRPEFLKSYYLLENNGKFLCDKEKEKMSKSKYNIINPDMICQTYGADTFRMYEMFLGPIHQSKPWNIRGIKGIKQFLKKFWNMFHLKGILLINQNSASKENLQIIHFTFKKVTEYINILYFNSAISTLMITINQFNTNNCNNIEILTNLIILLYPFAPYITEELWHQIGNKYSIYYYNNTKYIYYIYFIYTILLNGKFKYKINLYKFINKEVLIKKIINLPKTCSYLNTKLIENIIIFKKKIINLITIPI
jgi:leucyl-tRNA synthetase